MFENIGHFFKRIVKEPQKELGSKDAAKERLHLVLMQDRANVSADFLELMKQEIIDVIKKYIVVDEDSIDVRLTNQSKDDGTNGAPSLYANIPIVNIKNDMMAEKIKDFEGVDFNKEIGIPTYEEKVESQENTAVAEPVVIELPETVTNVEENINNNEENKEQEEEEVKELFEEVDEDDDDDDDVTFDDLLKAAEEAEKLAEESTEASEKVEKVAKKSTRTTKTTKTTKRKKRK
ncbi:MAG: cell division topological specificity factor MinE [Clostridia bacterium]|nr:cell division topological specificity factor MinE [Clostridia bacterium]